MFKVKLLNGNAKLPVRAHETDLGFDLYSAEEVIFEPGDIKLVDTAIAVEAFFGHEKIGFEIKDRSGIALKKNLFVHAGIIDPDYRGSIKVLLHNAGRSQQTIHVGDKFAQMLMRPAKFVTNFWNALPVRELSTTERSAGGFGSTGA